MFLTLYSVALCMGGSGKEAAIGTSLNPLWMKISPSGSEVGSEVVV